MDDRGKPKQRGGGNAGPETGLSRPDVRCRSDGRPHDTGMVRPYRPCPSDFRETFLELGWDGIDEHYHTNWRVIRRWIEEAGGEKLRAERRELSGGTARPTLRAKRFVLGRTLTAVKPRKG